MTCREGKLEESPKQRAVRALAARRNHQTALGKFRKFVLKRMLLVVDDVEIDGALVAWHRRGSQDLATVMDRRPSFRKSSTCGSIVILWVTYMCPSELLTLKKKDLVPPLVPRLPRLSIVIAGSETGVSTNTGIRDGSVWVNKLLPWPKCGNLVVRIWNFDYPAAAKLFKTAAHAFGLNGITVHQTCHSGASVHQVRGFRTLSSVTRYDISSRLVADYTSLSLSFAHSETSLIHSRNAPRATVDPAVRKRMT